MSVCGAFVCACFVSQCTDRTENGAGLEVRLSVADLVEEGGVELGLQLFVAVTLHDFGDFLFSPHMRRVVQVTLQPLPSANVDHRLPHEKP